MIAGHLAQQRRLEEYTHDELNELYAEAYIPVDRAAVAEANVANAGLADLVEARVGDARETLASVAGPIDMLLLDAWKDLNLPILQMLEPKLAPGAVIVADDIAVVPEIHAPYLAYVREGGGYHSAQVPIGAGADRRRDGVLGVAG